VGARRRYGAWLALALAASCGADGSSASSRNAFHVTGIIEGFYGPPYPHEDRLALLEFLGRNGLDHYVYAPKTDPYHRARWRDPYPEADLARFGELAAAAERAGVTFTFAVSPTDIVFTRDSDVEALTAKLDALWSEGVRSFTLSFDDTIPVLTDPGDLLHYGLDVGRAHGELANRVLAHLRSFGEPVELFFTPMDYNGAIQPYSHRLGETLDPGVPVFWTGSGVWSPTVDASYMDQVATALRRQALVWDNFPVNDGPFVNQLNLGRYRGRDPALGDAVDGVLLNTMIQPRASEVAVYQLGRYAAAPATYDPERAWSDALRAVAPGSAAFRLFANQSSASFLDPTESAELEMDVDALYDSFDAGGAAFQSAATALGDLLDRFAGIRAELASEVADPRLLAEIDPWALRLESLGRIGREGLDRIVAGRDSRPDRAQAVLVKALAVESASDPHRMCGDAIARFLSEGADRLALPPG